jgi:hypothetical protein
METGDEEEAARSSQPVRRASATLTRSVSEGYRKSLAVRRRSPRSRFGLVWAAAHQP